MHEARGKEFSVLCEYVIVALVTLDGIFCLHVEISDLSFTAGVPKYDHDLIQTRSALLLKRTKV